MSFLKKIGQHLVAPKADANLQLLDDHVVLGDNLEGTFRVSPRETIDADEVRCEISCEETAQVQRTDFDPVAKRMITRVVTENRVLFQAKPACNCATQIVSGVTRDFKFSINIPAGSRPTYMSIADSVKWEIKGVVAVHGRPDVTSQPIQFQVIPESQRPANEAPKIRLVACEYCQTAIPEDILVCPNCSAKRRV